MSSTKLVFFGPIGKTRWPPWPLIGWDIFYFSSETAERNSTKFHRKQDLNVLYQVCVFRADRKNKMTALASDWLRHFRLLLWNRWTEFNETWQEARSKLLLPSLCLSGRWVTKYFRSGWSVKKVAHCTQVHDIWPFGPVVVDLSSGTTERYLLKLYSKQELNVLLHFCVFRADRITNITALAGPSICDWHVPSFWLWRGHKYNFLTIRNTYFFVVIFTVTII